MSGHTKDARRLNALRSAADWVSKGPMSENSRSTKSNAAIALGRFRIFPRSRQLVAGEEVVPLGSRAFDMLLALIEAEGQLVSNDTLRKRIWGPGTNVDDHNISAQIWTIRKALGEEGRFIANDRGRGYRFTGPISWELRGRTPLTAAAGPHGLTTEVAQTNIAPPLSALIGRESELSVLSELLRTHRLVTLTGLGGVGKTSLAIAVARLVLPSFPSGVWLAELAAVAESEELIAGTIAKALGLGIGPHRDLAQCLKSLSADPVLLVIDNCDHVVDVVADFVEMMLRSVPSLRILVTSREPLAVEGERVYRVSPLEVPPPGVLKADQVLKYSAVQLFVHRAQAIDARFLLTDEATAIVGTICRRLDGIPLAIELAAGRVETLGVMEVANGLEDRFRLLTGGRRTALDRHQTLRATLDWSYRLLEEPEQTILRRLGIFANGCRLPVRWSLQMR